ncbi:hypothetical protein GQ43DRAFT_493069 [Delitschia confertaspora ATCC 74209]|uniref:Uncharacterized protein n=1 Tax=Delitschia confertaspora ATCC 74209 TaxID=1513339 RepID=A0A9P4JRT8_9PLEO|nr:hypothetical protein GQ43DRAFT_493069 [Delitschia confertaspora ATCC 74209]
MATAPSYAASYIKVEGTSGNACYVLQPSSSFPSSASFPSENTRPPNRANLMPLATIDEQKSYAVLDSGQRPVEGQRWFPSSKREACDSTPRSTVNPSHRRHSSALQTVKDQLADIITKSEDSFQHVRSNLRAVHARPLTHPARGCPPLNLPRAQLPQHYANKQKSNGGLRSFFWDALHRVRRASGRSSQVPLAGSNHREQGDNCEREIQDPQHTRTDQQLNRHDLCAELGVHTPKIYRFPWHRDTGSGSGNQRDDALSANSVSTMSYTSPPPLNLSRLEPSSSSFGLEGSSPSSSANATSAGRSRPNSNPFPLTSTPNLPHHVRDDASTLYTFDGIPLYRQNAPSLRAYDCNADTSLCSSTMYSSSIIGVDLDLQHPQPDTRLRNSNPSAAVIESPTAQTHSITSSVLPVLLPLAEASGIVHRNRVDSNVSFLSPSGNLIQPKESKSGHSREASGILEDTAYEPVRPTVLPSKHERVPSVGLPAHVQYERNIQCAYMDTPMRIKRSLVKGCDGIVRVETVRSRANTISSDLTTETTRYRMRAPSFPVQTHVRSAKGVLSTDDLVRKKKEVDTKLGWTLSGCFCQPWDNPSEKAKACLDGLTNKTTTAR